MSQLILGFGEALVDVLPTGEVVGGAPLNFSVRAAQLGQRLDWTAALISRIGNDSRGQEILEHLQTLNLDTCAIQVDSSLPTGYVDVTLQDGSPTYVIGEDVAWDAIAFDTTAQELSRRAAAICFGTLAQRSAHTAETLASCLEAADLAIKIFDINLRLPYPKLDIIERSLHHADVLKCNEEELHLLAQWFQLADTAPSTHPNQGNSSQPRDNSANAPLPAADIALMLQQRFDLNCLFWTRGSQGCVLQRADQMTTAPVPDLPKVANADSVGAGDAASAALAIGLVARWPDEKIVQVANYCGAFAASQRGATTPFPIQALMDQF